MKIIFDSIIYWLQIDGGASRYWYEITSRALQKENVMGQIIRNEPTLNPWFNPFNVKTFPQQFFLKSIDRYLDCKVSTAKSLNDIVFHSSHYRVPSNKSIANVVTVHDFTYEMHRKGIARVIHSWQKYRALLCADVIICISQYTKEKMLFFYPSLKNKEIKVIYHGLSSDFKILEIGDKNSNIIFLGARNDYKRFDLAVGAVSMSKDFILQIIGQPLSTFEVQLLNSTIPNRWVYSGRLSDQDLNIAYNNAFCFIYPSESEGFGLPLLEAMQAGCPVLCSNKSVFPEIAGSAALYANKQNPESYAAELNKLKNPEVRLDIVKKGLHHSAHFTWDKCFTQTRQAYELALKIRHEEL